MKTEFNFEQRIGGGIISGVIPVIFILWVLANTAVVNANGITFSPVQSKYYEVKALNCDYCTSVERLVDEGKEWPFQPTVIVKVTNKCDDIENYYIDGTPPQVQMKACVSDQCSIPWPVSQYHHHEFRFHMKNGEDLNNIPITTFCAVQVKEFPAEDKPAKKEPNSDVSGIDQSQSPNVDESKITQVDNKKSETINPKESPDNSSSNVSIDFSEELEALGGDRQNDYPSGPTFSDELKNDLENSYTNSHAEEKIKEIESKCECALTGNNCPGALPRLCSGNACYTPVELEIQKKAAECMKTQKWATRTEIEYCDSYARKYVRNNPSSRLKAYQQAEEEKERAEKKRKQTEKKYCEDIKDDLARGIVPYDPFPAWDKQKQKKFDDLAEELFSNLSLNDEVDAGSNEQDTNLNTPDTNQQSPKNNKKSDGEKWCLADRSRAVLCGCTSFYPEVDWKACEM